MKNKFLNIAKILNVLTKKLISYLYLLLFSIVLDLFFLTYPDAPIVQVWFTLSTFLFFVLLAQIHPIVLKIFLVFVGLLAAGVYPTHQIYGPIDFNYIASVYYTNRSEAMSYISILPLHVIIGLIDLVGIVIFLCFQKYARIRPWYWSLVMLIPLLLFPYTRYLKYQNQRKIPSFYAYVLPIKHTIDIVTNYYKVKEFAEQINTQIAIPSNWMIKNRSELKLSPNFVVVIGESVRREFLHCYGFPIENTPFLDTTSMIQFNNYTSVSTNTAPSLLHTLAISTEFPKLEVNNNIIRLAEKIGYHTCWISNQGLVGMYDTPISSLARNSEETHFINKGNYTAAGSDEKILPIFQNVLAKDTTPNFIVLHMMGSHPNPCELTGGKYDEFFFSDQVSCYNKTIRDLDTFLHQVYQQLQATGKPFTLIYLSDHGVVVNKDKSVVHGRKVKESMDVPLFIWKNDFTKKRIIHAKRTGRDFIHLFCQLNHFSTYNFTRSYRFISEQKDEDVYHKIVAVNGETFSWDKLPSEPLTAVYKAAKKVVKK